MNYAQIVCILSAIVCITIVAFWSYSFSRHGKVNLTTSNLIVFVVAFTVANYFAPSVEIDNPLSFLVGCIIVTGIVIHTLGVIVATKAKIS